MMDSQFYRSHWNYPSRPSRYYSPAVKEMPVRRQAPPVPKVVSIPVHFVRAEQNRSDSAVKIQKVLRGFLVRKSVKKIDALRKEVNEIEKKLLLEEIVELLRRDSKERLKVNETLMSLLIKLDSVRGLDSGVRDFRKAVIKKIIALQEMVDAIVVADQTVAPVNVTSEHDNVDTDADPANRGPEVKDSAEDLAAEADPKDMDQDLEVQDDCPEIKNTTDDSACNCNPSEIAVDQGVELHDHGKSTVAPLEIRGVPDSTSMPNLTNNEGILEALDQTSKSQVPEDTEAAKGNEEHMELNETREDESVDKEVVEDHGVETSVSECAESVGTTQAESQTDSSANSRSVIAGDEDEAHVGKHEMAMEINQPEVMEGKAQEQPITAEAQEENQRNRKLLQRMMEDNEKMMGLMADLFERNEMQTRLLSSLSHRVEQLERAYLCDRLRRKKRNAALLVDCLESTQDNKKCGSNCRK